MGDLGALLAAMIGLLNVGMIEKGRLAEIDGLYVSLFGTGGGGFNIGDIISQVTQGAQKNQGEQANSGGGLMDLIKGFMK